MSRSVSASGGDPLLRRLGRDLGDVASLEDAIGDVDAGMRIAGLYTLVATCEARSINPFAYLTDVIPRVHDDPKRRLDELLPGPWSRAGGEEQLRR
jgi:hypothetical protein